MGEGSTPKRENKNFARVAADLNNPGGKDWALRGRNLGRLRLDPLQSDRGGTAKTILLEIRDQNQLLFSSAFRLKEKDQRERIHSYIPKGQRGTMKQRT